MVVLQNFRLQTANCNLYFAYPRKSDKHMQSSGSRTRNQAAEPAASPRPDRHDHVPRIAGRVPGVRHRLPSAADGRALLGSDIPDVIGNSVLICSVRAAVLRPGLFLYRSSTNLLCKYYNFLLHFQLTCAILVSIKIKEVDVHDHSERS